MIDPIVDLNIKNILCRMQKQTGRIVLKPKESLIFDELRLAANADLFGIYIFDEKLDPYSQAATNHYEGFLNNYEEYRSFDPVLYNVLRHGSVTEASELLGMSGWERHPLCQFMAHWRLGHSMQAPLISGGSIIGTVNIARDQYRGKFRDQEVSWIWNISQIMSQILEKNTTLTQTRQQAAQKSVNQYNLVIESDGTGQIISETGNWPKYQGDDKLELIIQQSLEANLKKIAATKCAVATQRISTPPPNIEQISIITASVSSLSDLYLTTVIGMSSLVPQTQLNLDLLPPRTKKVAEYLLRGYSNNMIAQELEISENTVKDHVRKIYSRYGAHNKAEFAWLVNSPLKIC